MPDVDDPTREVAEPASDTDQSAPTGLLTVTSDFALYGVYNGTFGSGGPLSLAGSNLSAYPVDDNVMPGWRFVQSSNANITAAQVRDTSSPSGSNLRFTFVAGLSTDAAYVEQVVDIGGSRQRETADYVRAFYLAGSGNTGTFGIFLELQYLDMDMLNSGGGVISSTTIAAGTTNSIQKNASGTFTAPPSDAKYLRIRVGVKRLPATNGQVGTVDITTVRREWGRPWVLIPDQTDTTQNPSLISQVGGLVQFTGPGANPGYLLMGDSTQGVRAYSNGGSHGAYIAGQMATLPFYLDNVAAAGTTSMHFGYPGTLPFFDRCTVPWAGMIVGIAMNATAALTAGNIQFKGRVGASTGSTILTITSGANRGGSSQAVFTQNFSAGDDIGIEATTNGAYLPTTNDYAGVLYVLYDYDAT